MFAIVPRAIGAQTVPIESARLDIQSAAAKKDRDHATHTSNFQGESHLTMIEAHSAYWATSRSINRVRPVRPRRKQDRLLCCLEFWHFSANAS
jgi:hypothetical protein